MNVNCFVGSNEPNSSDEETSEEEESTRCCNGSLYGMRTPLNARDTHRCYSCKKRMHGGIMCAVFESDDYSGHLF